MTGPLVLRYARNRVSDFEEQSKDLMQLHLEAMDCRDCEVFLQLGIDAFRWLIRADEGFRQDVYAEKVSDDEYQKIDGILRLAFKAWLSTSKPAETWAADQLKRGYQVDNLGEFRECLAEVVAIVESFRDSEDASDAVINLQNKAIADYRNGKTSEFV